jgi:hypothetical protein
VSNIVATLTPDEGEDLLDWDYQVQEKLNEAIHLAMDADGEAARPIFVQSGLTSFQVTKIVVSRQAGDESMCEVVLHVQPI